MIPTFRQWLADNKRVAWPRRPMTPPTGSDPYAYYCPMPDPIAAQVDRIHIAARQPLFTPTDKRPGDRVLGSGGVWSEVL